MQEPLIYPVGIRKIMIHMQEVLLSRILKEKMRSLGALDRGSKMIMERLRRKKNFIVLDDVDKLSQIEVLPESSIHLVVEVRSLLLNLWPNYMGPLSLISPSAQN